MKTKFQLTILFLFFTHFVWSQQYTLDWVKKITEETVYLNYFNLNTANPNIITGSTTIITDHEDNTIVTGSFREEINIDGIVLTSEADTDFFIAKFDPNGEVIWAKRGGGNSNSYYCTNLATDWINSTAVDDFGNIYATGVFVGQATFGNITISTYPFYFADVFLAKYNPDGNILWVEKIFGGDWDVGAQITLDDQNNVYFLGNFYSSSVNFNQQAILYDTEYSSVIAKYSSDGNLIWAKEAIDFGTYSDFYQLCSFDVDSEQNIYLNTRIIGSSVIQDTTIELPISQQYSMLVKYNNNGNLVWAKTLNGNGSGNGVGIGDNYSRSISIDDSDNIYMSGHFTDTMLINGNNYISQGDRDIYITKLNTDGDVIWVTTAGDDKSDECYDMTLSPQEIILTGRFENSLQFGNQVIESNGIADIFVSRIDKENGNHIHSQALGGDTTDIYADLGHKIYYRNNSILLTGNFYGTIDLETDTISSNGEYSAFAIKWKCGGEFNAPSIIACESFLSPSGNLITVSGNYSDTLINEFGCDSISQYDVTIVSIDATVTQNNATVTANATNTNYQWIDCSTNQIIPNETNQNFTASVTGTYAVEVTQNGCTSVSECVDVIISNLDNYELAKDLVKIYPNPSPSIFNLEFTSFQENINASLISIDGKILKEWNIKNQNSTQINLANYANGVYWLKLKSEENTYVLKITKIE